MDLDKEEKHLIDVTQAAKEVDNDLSIFTVGSTSKTHSQHTSPGGLHGHGVNG